MQKSGNVKMRLKTKSQWGKKVILPTVGETEIGEDGVFEIIDTVATLLLNHSQEYLLMEGNGTTVTAEAHPGKVDEDSPEYIDPKAEEETEAKAEVEVEVKVEVEETEDEETEVEETEDELKEKTLSQLLDIAKEADIPTDEYKKFKKSKKLMYNFLKKYSSED
jgi:predicted RNA-binding protein with PUA-like domain